MVAQVQTSPGPFRRAFARIGRIMTASMEADARLKLVHRLQDKSNAELAAMGLKREDIVRYAFRDVM
ncbi:DUF1127 domain-containing protein [Palleronia sediminis]|uniref:DUF1127 domain-containing protein n=1 Tax=Palleronia sediminis TaxID=2547833 RepID=A0A4R6AL44_9RHOB|nr:DUF1127 domain-containing protein [Palleronia sediminis]TDL84145.1 DUF1127 domain-containing protein [Palleronia sediminis]